MTIEQVVRDVAAEYGVMSAHRVEKVQKQADGVSFEAFAEMKNSGITIKYDPGFKVAKNAKTFAFKKNVKDPVAVCVRDIAGHEHRHIHNRKFVGIPGDVEAHEEYFFTPIAEVLESKDKMGATSTVCNLVQDLMINTAAEPGRHTGLALFYDEVARAKPWEKAYDAYMRMQVYCWWDEVDKQLLTPYFKKDKKVQDAVQQFTSALGKIAGKRSKGRLERADYLKIFGDKKKWKSIAAEFASAIEPLIDNSFSAPSCGFGKQMEKEMEDPMKREKFARKHYEGGDKIPNWMEKEEALDAVYASLAREITIKVEAPRKATSLPLVPYMHQPFNPDDHRLSQINFQRPVIVPESNTPFGIEALNFSVPERHIERNMMVKKGLTSFPEFKCAYIDCSSSMLEGIPRSDSHGSKDFIPWGDKSKYHYVCKAWYGIIEYLARQQILPNVEISLGAFSDSSRVKRGLEESKKLLFNPAFGGTEISASAVDKLLSGGKSVFFTVSDGEISNWNDVKSSFVKKAKNHYYFHIQIGPDSEMTSDLREEGLPVYNVRTGDELERMAITLARNAYQTHIDSSMAHLR
jgi:hypothetical protein